jgi:tubulin polyglutamylase TTLL1
MIHLTNDAIQKQSKDYGSFEEGNKISYLDLQRYFEKNYPCRHFDFKMIYIKMREIAKNAIASTYLSLSQSKKIHKFEIFGLDYMIDDHLKVHLIEINTNPCLEISSGLLGRIIPLMVEQTFRVSLDVIFPPNAHYPNNSKSLAPECSL